MRYLVDARKLDADDRLLDAIAAYEFGLQESDVTLDDYLNCALIYFALCDFGLASHLHLTMSQGEKFWNRANLLLEEAMVKYGDIPEISFWKLYFPYRYIFSEINTEEVELIAEKDSSLVSYFYLDGMPGHEDSSEVKELYQRVCDGSTKKKRYIKSILDSKANLLKLNRDDLPSPSGGS